MKFNFFSLLFYGLPMVLSSLISALSFSEYYNVAIYKKENSAYPFGYTNDGKWYYLNENNYANFNLYFGLSYLLCSFLFLLGFYRKNDFILIISTILFIILFIVERIIMEING